jgi:hypothetical protein
MKRLISMSLLAAGSLYCLSFAQNGQEPAASQAQTPPPPLPESQAAAPSQAPAGGAPSFSIDSIAIAGNIEQRMPVGVGGEFAWDVGRVSCWARVSASQAPVAMKFKWYKNEELALEWPYSLISETGRVWSTKAVATGNWKVEIVDAAGNVVKTASFTIKEHTM